MTSAKWKWALGVSVVLNIFLIAGGIGASCVLQRHLHDLRRPAQGQGYQPWLDVEARLSPQSSAYVHKVLKDAALGTYDDLDKARHLRGEAENLAWAPNYDAGKIVAMAEEARSYENMSRAKIETALINSLATLPPKERGTVAGYILRPGFRIRYALYDGKHEPHGPKGASQPPQAAAPSSAPK
jgi:uncharacterized membrane protein